MRSYVDDVPHTVDVISVRCGFPLHPRNRSRREAKQVPTGGLRPLRDDTAAG